MGEPNHEGRVCSGCGKELTAEEFASDRVIEEEWDKACNEWWTAIWHTVVGEFRSLPPDTPFKVVTVTTSQGSVGRDSRTEATSYPLIHAICTLLGRLPKPPSRPKVSCGCLAGEALGATVAKVAYDYAPVIVAWEQHVHERQVAKDAAQAAAEKGQ